MNKTPNTNLTADITSAQIRALRTEAIAAGDYLQVDLCDLALAAHETAAADGSQLLDPGGHPISRSEARAICAEAIDAIRARAYNFSLGDIVECGRPGTEDHDTGKVVEIDGHRVRVAWGSMSSPSMARHSSWHDAADLRARLGLMSPDKLRVLSAENDSVTVARQGLARAQDALNVAQRAANRYPLAFDHAEQSAAVLSAEDAVNASKAALKAAIVERDRVIALWEGVA